MLHLFNNVFIEQDSQLSVFYKVVVISSEYNTDMETNPNCIHYALSIDDLLKRMTLEEFFHDLLKRSEKVVIYANNEAFARIYSAWVKSTTNLRQQDYEFVIDCYKYKCETFLKNNTQLFELLKSYWATAPSYNFSNVEFGPSYEFALASALYNPDFSRRPQFLSLLTSFVKRQYEYVILEARKYIDQYCLDEDLQRALGGSDVGINDIFSLPKMSVYREPYFKEDVDIGYPANPYQPGRSSKLDISLCTEQEMVELCKVTDDVIFIGMNSAPPYNYFEYDAVVSHFEARGWKYLNSVRQGQLSHAEYLAILEEIIAEKMNLIYTPLDLRDSILFVMLPHLKKLKRRNDAQSLFYFTLK